jgi:hypothetical protein
MAVLARPRPRRAVKKSFRFSQKRELEKGRWSTRAAIYSPPNLPPYGATFPGLYSKIALANAFAQHIMF